MLGSGQSVRVNRTMRQTYDVIGGPEAGRRALPLLRDRLASMGLDGVFIPHEDEYQNEYLPDCNERLAWATGFTGSAGAAFIFIRNAIVFVDGRYTLQAAAQLDPELFATADLADPGPFGWLAGQSLAGSRIGYDPRLLSPEALDRLTAAAARCGASLVSTLPGPVDTAWSDRPSEPIHPVTPHDLVYAGETSASKRTRLAAKLRDDRLDAAVITSPASIAWLFNIRGADVSRTPLPLGRAILHADGRADLFIRPEKTSPVLVSHLGSEVTLRPESDLAEGLSALSGRKTSVDPSAASAWFFTTLESAGAIVVRGPDPCILPRARKNSVEVEGARRAHRRDGAALCRFLRWFDEHGQTGAVTEIDAAIKLETCREETGELMDLSFNSISSAGPNGAINHYRPDVATNRPLERGGLFLIDSGGQYRDGTTDVTRTLAIGDASEEMKDRFTRVLKGHIALASVRFPKGVTGSALDVLARMALWEGGFDYDHGTGHGVGSYLGVHEGPQRIAKAPNAAALEPGMIISNEPGYYKAGHYGIRIENLIVVSPPRPVDGGDREMMTFETLTLAPIDRRLILADRLTLEERRWVNDYHARVAKELAPLLSKDDAAWLSKVCAPV